MAVALPDAALLVGGSLAYLVNAFLPWTRLCIRIPVETTDAAPDVVSCEGLHLWADGLGVLCGVLAVGVLFWELLTSAGVHLGAWRALTSTLLAGGLAALTLIRVLADVTGQQPFVSAETGYATWIGIGLGLFLALGAAHRLSEHNQAFPRGARPGV